MTPELESMSREPTSSSVRPLLIKRAAFFQKVRSFFFERDVIEVDTPVLVSSPPNDANIDIMRVKTKGTDRYLTSSPEYLMKRLLALGSEDIFQLCHVYRDGEIGRNHNPFFTMVEWYRTDFVLEDLIQECIEFLHYFDLNLPVTRLGYRERFLRMTGIDPLNCQKSDLTNLLHPYFQNVESFSLEELIDAAFVTFVEPQMKDGIHIVDSFLPFQAALAKIEGAKALRFEIYIKGIEIANGYEELNDPQQIQDRFNDWNAKRVEPLVVDPRFLDALQHLPAVSGVALGADRLFMILENKDSISAILPFDYMSS